MFGVRGLPILSTVPRSGTWYLLYAISFLCHLERGGRIDDRLTGRIFGDPSGPAFDFRRFKGGPLFHVRGTLPDDHLFIGHTVCPGFDAGGVGWWSATRFHVPGYDYFHEGMNYRYTPIDLAPYDYATVRVAALERATAKGKGRPVVLVYRNPIDQAASYFRYSMNHKDATYNSLAGRPLSRVPFNEYLLGSALPSYARQFISFQALSERYPARVRLVAYEHLMREPVEVLSSILDHLAGAVRQRPALADAVWLARREHLRAVEKELGRSLDGTRNGRSSHITQANARESRHGIDSATRNEILTMLASMGINTGLFEWPEDDFERPARKAASAA
jgi:hypothetical protein